MYKDLSPYMLRNSLNVQIPLAKKNILFNSFFQKKVLVCGMHYQFLSNLPLVFHPLNYVKTLSTEGPSITVGTFMIATHAIHHYAVDCAWVTVS